MSKLVTNRLQGIQSARSLAAYLATLPKINASTDRKPQAVIVTIGAHSYFGACYYDSFPTLTGEFKRHYYLLGRMADTLDCGTFYKPRRNFAYVSADNRTFYAGYGVSESVVTDQRYAWAHTFGVWFSLSEMSADILTNDRTGKPYPTKSFDVEFVG